MAETAATYVKGVLYALPVADLLPDSKQPRKEIDGPGLELLRDSIAAIGIQVPLLVRQDPSNGLIYIVAGERRFLAARMAGLAAVPAVFIDADVDTATVALLENVCRLDLTAIEEAEALQQILNDKKFNQDQLAKLLGRPRQTVNESLILNRLPAEVRNACRGDRQIAKSTLLKIARKKQERGMISAYEAYKAKLNRPPQERAKSNPNDPAPMLKAIDAAKSKLFTLNASGWSDEDKNTLVNQLNDLKGRIETFLDNPFPERAPSKKPM